MPQLTPAETEALEAIRAHARRGNLSYIARLIGWSEQQMHTYAQRLRSKGYVAYYRPHASAPTRFTFVYQEGGR